MKTVRWFALILPAFLAATAPASMLSPVTAFATPSAGTEAVTISQAAVDGIDYITREITIQPGGSTGWHYHDGRTFGVVREGTLTRTMEDCSEMISPTGVGVTEEAGTCTSAAIWDRFRWCCGWSASRQRAPRGRWRCRLRPAARSKGLPEV
jgi:hypothetical protein